MGWHGFGRKWHRMALPYHLRRAVARDGWIGLHHDLLGRLCRCCQRHRRSPERRVRCQHTKIAMPMGAWRWHQRHNALYQLQRCEVQFVYLGTSHVTCGLTVLLGAAVDQGRALFAQTIHCKRWAGAAAQQPLQGGAVVCFDAHPRVHREPALPRDAGSSGQRWPGDDSSSRGLGDCVPWERGLITRPDGYDRDG